jgi:hypothetical protein
VHNKFFGYILYQDHIQKQYIFREKGEGRREKGLREQHGGGGGFGEAKDGRGCWL